MAAAIIWVWLLTLFAVLWLIVGARWAAALTLSHTAALAFTLALLQANQRNPRP